MRHTNKKLGKLLTSVLLAMSFAAQAAPRPDHVVLVIEENHGYRQIMDKTDSYIRTLAKRGMLFTQSYGVTHPSQPNYLALFSGSTQSSTNDYCPLNLDGDNLALALMKKGMSFATFSESLPTAGDTGCSFGQYKRKHNPAVNWQNLPASTNLRFSDFPQDYSKLPTVSFVIPNQENDMHDGSVATGDVWLKKHIEPYVQWAGQHNSLLILTWDEDDGSEGNRIVTIFAGPMVKTGTSDQRIDHYNVLRTLLDMYELPAINESRNAVAIESIWNKR